MWHRLRHWIPRERLLFVIQVIIVVVISIIINLLHVDIIWLLRGGWILIGDLLHGAVGCLIFLITSTGVLQRRCPSLHQRLRQRSRSAGLFKNHVENRHVFEMIKHTRLQRSEWL